MSFSRLLVIGVSLLDVFAMEPVTLLLKGAGTSKPVTGTSKVVIRLRNNRALLDRLGLTLAETKQI